MEKVKALLSNNNFSEALLLLLEYVKKNPDDIDVIFHLGKVYFYLKEYSKSFDCFHRILNTKNIDNNLLLWSKYFIANIIKFKEPQKALDLLISIREINSNDINKEINLLIYEILKDVQQFNFQGQYDRTIELYNKYFSYVSKDDKFLFNKFLNEYEIASKQTILKSKPRSMLVILSNVCNINCIMCGQRHEKRTIMGNKFINLIKENVMFLEKIIWQGGEPFLYPNFEDLLIFFSKNKKLKQIVITNFLLLDEKIMEFIIKNKINLVISVDGAKKDTYEQIRKGASFDKIISNLNSYNEILKKHNIEKGTLQINFVVMKENYKEIAEIIEFAHKYNIEKITFIKCFHYIEDKGKNLSIENLQEIKNILLPLAYKKAREYSIIIDNQLDSIFDSLQDISNQVQNKAVNNNDILYCHLPWQEITISYENIIKANCLCLKEDYYNKENINSLMDLWNSKIFVNLRKNIIDNNLKNCSSNCMFIDKSYLKPNF